MGLLDKIDHWFATYLAHLMLQKAYDEIGWASVGVKTDLVEE